jgi:hypothetical protein
MNEGPPILGRWWRLYGLVILNLLLCILLFRLFSKVFA